MHEDILNESSKIIFLVIFWHYSSRIVRLCNILKQPFTFKVHYLHVAAWSHSPGVKHCRFDASLMFHTDIEGTPQCLYKMYQALKELKCKPKMYGKWTAWRSTGSENTQQGGQRPGLSGGSHTGPPPRRVGFVSRETKCKRWFLKTSSFLCLNLTNKVCGKGKLCHRDIKVSEGACRVKRTRQPLWNKLILSYSISSHQLNVQVWTFVQCRYELFFGFFLYVRWQGRNIHRRRSFQCVFDLVVWGLRVLFRDHWVVKWPSSTFCLMPLYCSDLHWWSA